MAWRMLESEIVDAMANYGGSFVKGLAHLYNMADFDNRRILVDAFAHYFKEYDEIALRHARAWNRGTAMVETPVKPERTA